MGGLFELEELQSKVTVNKNTYFRATFSGTKLIEGSEITIIEGIIDIIYNAPLEE